MSLPIAKQLHENFIAFLDELIEIFPNESDLILARVFLKDAVSSETIMHSFIKNVLPHKEEIKARNDGYLLTFDFNFDQQHKINHIRNIWKSAALDDNDRQTIWRWFDLFIFFCERYQTAKVKEETEKKK
jgi:hypothetical protein